MIRFFNLRLTLLLIVNFLVTCSTRDDLSYNINLQLAATSSVLLHFTDLKAAIIKCFQSYKQRGKTNKFPLCLVGLKSQMCFYTKYIFIFFYIKQQSTYALESFQLIVYMYDTNRTFQHIL